MGWAWDAVWEWGCNGYFYASRCRLRFSYKQLHNVRESGTKTRKEQRQKCEAVKCQSRLPSPSAAEPGQAVLSTGSYCNAGFHYGIMTRTSVTQVSSVLVSVLPFHFIALVSYRKQTKGRQIPTCANTSSLSPSRSTHQTSLTSAAQAHTVCPPCYSLSILSGGSCICTPIPELQIKGCSFPSAKDEPRTQTKKHLERSCP